MPWIDAILASRVTAIVGRVLLTFPFWASGIAKLVDFPGGVAEMRHFGLEPAPLFNILTLVVQLSGSALIIADRLTWLGAGALGVFTFLTIILVHHFWSLSGEEAVVALHIVTEHVGMIGALVLVSVMSVNRKRQVWAAFPIPREKNGPPA